MLGNIDRIGAVKEELGLNFDCEEIDVRYDPRRRGSYAQELHDIRGRKGVTLEDATRLMKNSTYFAPMMVHMGDADGYLGGVSHHYPDIVKPCLQIIGPEKDSHRIVGMYMMTVGSSPSQNTILFLSLFAWLITLLIIDLVSPSLASSSSLYFS